MSWSDITQAVYSWGIWVSVIVFLVSLLIMPVIIVSLPKDYFIRAKRVRDEERPLSISRSVLNVTKNLFGLLLIAAGILMLVLPGQGLLTILAGLMVMNFPGKYRLERWLVGHKSIARSINWIRRRANKPMMHFDYVAETERQ